MKKINCSFLILFVYLYLPAQQNVNDSLRQLLTVTREDTAKINLLNRLAGSFVESKPDSVLFYANTALELSRKINFDKGEIATLLNTAAGYTLSGNYSKALESGLEALQKK